VEEDGKRTSEAKAGCGYVIYGTAEAVPFLEDVVLSQGFTGCGKSQFFEGYGLQPVRNNR